MTDKRMIAVFHYDNGRYGSEPYKYEELKRGEWILTPYTDCSSPVYECSVCTHGVSGDLQVRNFCPNCGADMREREGE